MLSNDRPARNVVICEMRGGREHVEGDTVSLVYDEWLSRIVIRAFNEFGNNFYDDRFHPSNKWIGRLANNGNDF
jgi:hypothetical protein